MTAHIRRTAAIVLFVGTTASAQTTRHVNVACGNDTWTGTSNICSAPNGPKKTIQAAIAASASGDTVLVAPGINAGPIDFLGRAITLRSTSGAAVTEINGGAGAPVVSFVTGEGRGSVLDGFTVSGGNLFTGSGAGIRVQGASPTIQNCTVTGNSCSTVFANIGAGVAVLTGGPLLQRCQFTNNTGQSTGVGALGLQNSTATVLDCRFTNNDGNTAGAVYCEGGSPLIARCIMASNNVNAFADGPGGILIQGGTAAIANCLIHSNRSINHPGVYAASGSPTMVNCTLTLNTGSSFIGKTVNGPVSMANCIVWNNQVSGQVAGGASAVYSNIQGGFAGAGNIATDPLLVSASGYRLGTGSPCIDAGSNPAYFASPAATFIDLVGAQRGVDIPGIADTGSGLVPLIDMGAYEVQLPVCYANCDGSTLPPILNVNDFQCFMTMFAGGCP